MTSEAFYDYATRILLPGITGRRATIGLQDTRCLLLLDSHSSRSNPNLWKRFQEAQIDVLTLVSHSSHLTQPLDCGIFAVFKKTLNSKYSIPTDTAVKSYREALAAALPDALATATMTTTIKSAFERSGVLSHQSHRLLSLLPDKPSLPPFIKQPPIQAKGFNFYGKLITDDSFLQSWLQRHENEQDIKSQSSHASSTDSITSSSSPSSSPSPDFVPFISSPYRPEGDAPTITRYHGLSVDHDDESEQETETSTQLPTSRRMRKEKIDLDYIYDY
jgi:hypothetical protein